MLLNLEIASVSLRISSTVFSHFSTMCEGSLGGPEIDTQFIKFTVGYPNSAVVGTSGNRGDRSLLVIARGLTKPPEIATLAEAVVEQLTFTWPPATRVTAADAP